MRLWRPGTGWRRGRRSKVQQLMAVSVIGMTGETQR